MPQLDDVVRARARALATEVLANGWDGPPFDMEVLASFVDLEVRHLQSLGDGREAALDGRRLLVADGTSAQRRRFSIAHEIAHTLVSDACLPGTCGPGEVERLCNVAAAELIIPASTLDTAVAGDDWGLEVALRVASTFGVSFEVCLRRLVGATVDRAALIIAAPDQDETLEAGWNPRRDGMWEGELTVKVWQVNTPPFLSLKGVTIPRQCSLHWAWSWLRAKGEARIRRDWLEWPTYPELGRFVVEAIPNPQRRPAREVMGLCWWPADTTVKARMVPTLRFKA